MLNKCKYFEIIWYSISSDHARYVWGPKVSSEHFFCSWFVILTTFLYVFRQVFWITLFVRCESLFFSKFLVTASSACESWIIFAEVVELCFVWGFQFLVWRWYRLFFILTHIRDCNCFAYCFQLVLKSISSQRHPSIIISTTFAETSWSYYTLFLFDVPRKWTVCSSDRWISSLQGSTKFPWVFAPLTGLFCLKVQS